ncbi:hypothetical protein [Fusobacterium sp. SYSU M8D902]|uniref:hypothetical protein n=1 Tax=Fusobacterium sp. SYSU M8D902 TaxID=3159562 RepID=UPI0032E3FB0C
MKRIILFMFLLAIPSLAKVEIKILEPLRFEYFNTRMLGGEKIAGYGTIEIKAEKEDFGKKLVFQFPKKGLLTNRKKWIEVEEYGIEVPNKEIEINQETVNIKFYSILNRRNIDKGEEADIIEGKYNGYVPIIISQYGKLGGE